MPKKTQKTNLLYAETSKEIPLTVKQDIESIGHKRMPQEFWTVLDTANTERETKVNQVCKKYVPKLYKILRKDDLYTPEIARNLIIQHTVNVDELGRGFWKYETVMKWMPHEAKNRVKSLAAIEGRRQFKEKKIKQELEQEEKVIKDVTEETAKEIEEEHKKSGLGSPNVTKTQIQRIVKQGYKAAKKVRPNMESENGKMSAAQRWGTINVLIHDEEHLQIESAWLESRKLNGGSYGLYTIRLNNGEFESVEPTRGSLEDSQKRNNK